MLPSKRIASEAGDLGLAMLWIVQASLVRGLRADITALGTQNMALFNDIGPAAIGALAHSDDRNRPVILSNGPNGPILNGTKRYITGGTTSDYILITAKERPEDKIFRMFAFRAADIPEGSLTELDLGSLKTVSHGTLTLNDCVLKESQFIPLEGKELRRSIKRWSIIERSLIMQSFLGLMSYINSGAENETETAIIQKDRLDAAIQQADETVTAQVAAAGQGGLIEEKNPDFRQITEFIRLYNAFLELNGTELSEGLRARFPDLNFMQKARP